jgi:hypothetical protein
VRIFRNMQFLNNGRITRRVIGCVLFLSFFLSFFYSIPVVHAQIAIAGDLAPRGNPDGRLTMADVIVLERMVLGEITPTEEELLIGDVAPLGGPDGVLDMADVLVLQRAVFGEISLPPVAIAPPDPADATKIDLEFGDGQITVIGAAGSVEPYATVTIVDYGGERRTEVTVTANADGSFRAQLAGNPGDMLSVNVSNNMGDANSSTQIRAVKIVILEPLSGATVYGNSAIVNGMFWAPSYASVTVNGIAAATSGNTFFASVPLNPGTNVIAATVFTESFSVQKTITVISAGASSPIQVTVNPLSGAAPLQVQFLAQSSGPPVQRIRIDFDGNGTIDFDSSVMGLPPGNSVTHVYSDPGVYRAAVIVTDGSGNVYDSIHTLSARSAKDMMLRDIYENMLNNLRQGNIEGAVAAFSGSVQEKYQAIFTTLQSDLPTIVNQFGTLDSGLLADNWAEYVLLRNENGEPRAYLLYFLRSEDGVWRIDGM